MSAFPFVFVVEEMMHNDSEMRTGKRRRSLIELEEERVWVGLYRRAADPVVAAELVAYMEHSGEMRTHHSGLYLRCKHVLRREKARQVRLRKVSASLRWAVHLVFGVPFAFTLRLLRSMGTILLACLPERDDNAVIQLRKLTSDQESQPDVGQWVSPSGSANSTPEQVVAADAQLASADVSKRSTRRAGGTGR
ncbi:hypothetical protein [Janthinobacterium sp. 1_2014MBL_MicDiv]|uniref:hypothetical protein n=1 Tax=Janthinobacterium sp. 1_2014MBL_MicDiv TaxID=1644131 RepID=UPI0012EBAC24|nr:hypothetical protein [Janthinobacterium sp. 1_2014MBL_MicDiv]